MILFNFIVTVPGLTGPVPELDKANAPFDQPAGHQALLGVHSVSVGLESLFRFPSDVKRITCLHLHAVGELKGADPGIQAVIAGTV